MAKKLKRRSPAVRYDDPLVGDEVKQSVFAILLAAFGAILLLAFFGMAGSFGASLDGALAVALGAARIAVPILLFLIGANVVLQDRQLITFRGLFAFVLFIVSLNGLLNLLFVRDPSDAAAMAKAGGMVGTVISNLLVGALGYWASLIVALACLLAALVVIFNTSVKTMMRVPLAATGVLGLLRRGNGDDESPAEEDDGETFEERQAREALAASSAADEDTVDDEVPMRRAAVFAGKAEQVMTSRERRTIEIPLELLDDKSSDARSGDLERGQEIIIKTLHQFGIESEMAEVRVGPTVTQYALRPPQGVKLSRIVALQNDLALALAAHPIRIEAPIPGKSLVGIEVPNQTIGRVCLRELLESKEFSRRKSSFTVPVGKDITGSTQLISVDRAPHMLVAGATGSGKSVCLNDIIISLLYQNGPDDLKLILVDPKRVELSVYAGIPHLLVPPIVKADEAINALKWAVREMERRLDYLSKFGAKDIDSYNQKSKERMPRIVIIIDELADLMSQNKRDVEAVIVRIAQMARAAGIHLIVATQRPSVDVITGTIKANIPTRLAFAVASQVDSKTILDIAGADKLLGRGDMLLATPELTKPKRAQGAYVSEAEIERVVDFLKKEGEPDYNNQITESANSAGGVMFDPENSDVLLEDAIAIAIDAGKVSTSFLQRRMKIGYSRAARIVDIMVELGIVGEADGAKPREVLVDEWPPAGMERDERMDLAENDAPADDENEEENDDTEDRDKS